jgi:CrcB protein
VTAVVVALAGGSGAILRFLVTRAVDGLADRPGLGTDAVNLAGAIGIGVVVGLVDAGRLEDPMALVASAGLLGGFTTFSTWMVDSLATGRAPVMFRRTFVMVVAGGFAVVAGLGLATLFA